MNNSKYYTDYPTEPIGDGNPYYRCSHCGISEPAINGRLDRHLDECEYRISKEQQGYKDSNDGY